MHTHTYIGTARLCSCIQVLFHMANEHVSPWGFKHSPPLLYIYICLYIYVYTYRYSESDTKYMYLYHIAGLTPPLGLQAPARPITIYVYIYIGIGIVSQILITSHRSPLVYRS